MIKCYGRNPRTGRKVGERHCWFDREYGGDGRRRPRGVQPLYRCLWCDRSKDELQDPKPEPGPTLEQALAGD